MAMSCVDSKEKLSDSQMKIGIEEKTATSGKPCIDFQPDDRWQIKEDKALSRVTNNSIISDVKNSSNGQRSQRISSSKSSESVSSVNGEAFESSSEDESKNKVNKDQGIDVKSEESGSLNNEHIGSKRRLDLKLESIDCISVNKKKMKLNDNNSSEEEITEQCEVEKCDLNETVNDSNSKTLMPELSPALTNIQKDDLDVSLEIIEPDVSETETSTTSKNFKNDENDCEVLSDLKELKKVNTSDHENTVSESEVKVDADIEIININDEGKKSSGEESDSEVQIINLEENKTKSIPVEFPTGQSLDENINLSAGFPYYNFIKESFSGFKAGDYKPVKFPHTGTLLLADNEVIIESPSLLVPLLIKEADEFPKVEEEEKAESAFMAPKVTSKRNFFQSSVGQFLINLGMSRVQEWYHRDMKRAKLKQIRKTTAKDEELEKALKIHEKKYAELKEINASFNFRMRCCKFCSFKSESQAVMEDHYLIPHLSPRREYKCNFCMFLSRDPEAIIFHFEAMHGKKAILDNYVPFHECIFCSFQSHLKTKVNAHMNRCRKHFIPSQNLAPPFDFEFPGVTTKPVTIQDVIGHRRLLLSSAKNQRLPIPDDNSNSAYARKKLASVLSKLSGQNTYTDTKNPSLMKQLMTSQSSPLLGSASQLPPGIVITRPRGTVSQVRPAGGRYPQPRGVPTNLRAPPPRQTAPYTINLSSTASQLASSGISITPVTRPSATPSRANTLLGKNVTLTPISTNRTVTSKGGRPPTPVTVFTSMASSSSMMGQPQARLPVTMNFKPLRPAPPYQRLNTPPSQIVKGSSGNTFVMCEICDSYIKDLEELRTHMNWVHKVKIHPKMLVSRPPLNCQKCQWRFFTDQGLERHLLGAHGLVTTNMQEMANKNQDGGRCIICGAVFTYKLVSHMTQVHKVTLKPAHLSYKCTVCTATFTLYRLFESHVYNVHSGSSKRPTEESVLSEPTAKRIPSEEVGPKKCRDCGLVTENMQDHLIKMHMKKCSVKLCHIEKCEKCLYSSDEMLVIRMSDFGLDDDLDDSGDDDDDDSSGDSSDKEEMDTNEKLDTLKEVEEQPNKKQFNDGQLVQSSAVICEKETKTSENDD